MIASYVASRARAVSRQNRPQDAQTGRSARPQRTKRRIVLVPYGEPLRFTTRGITRVTFVNAAEPVRRPCLARTPLAHCFRILLGAGQHHGEEQDQQGHQQRQARDERRIPNQHSIPRAPLRLRLS